MENNRSKPQNKKPNRIIRNFLKKKEDVKKLNSQGFKTCEIAFALNLSKYHVRTYRKMIGEHSQEENTCA